ncbi:MAG: RnfABCDGE type electron transport complex subunit B [Actinomycetia bacterium]|nr:RnfABCDGE type electron transport complex subunit B [Actinomycetes bacterium]
MLLTIIKAVAALAGLGVLAASMLSIASQQFHVEVDSRVEAVAAALPGANCGACGNPSCFAVAEAIVAGALPVTSCVAGGQSVAEAIAGLMGSGACEVVAVVAARHCGGGASVLRTYEYGGVQSCNAVVRLAGGPLACSSGCFGYGDCVRACPFDAMSLDERGLPVIDTAACTGCGICVRECPRGQISLLELVPEAAPVVVRCNAHDKPKDRKKACSACCIACKKCEKECPSDAVHVVDLQAVIDYTKCTGCGTCVKVCPQKCIDLYAGPVRSMDYDGKGPAAVSAPDAVGAASGSST